MSMGSSLAESAVEATRSQNITAADGRRARRRELTPLSCILRLRCNSQCGPRFARATTDQLLVDGPPLIMPISLVPELVAKLAALVKAGSPANRRADGERRTH